MSEERTEEYFYRFNGMSDDQFAELKQACSGLSFESKWSDRAGGYVVCIPLINEQTGLIVQTFLSAQTKCSVKHGVYISLVTDDDQAGFSVPDFILNLLRSSKGTMDVSFTVV